MEKSVEYLPKDLEIGSPKIEEEIIVNGNEYFLQIWEYFDKIYIVICNDNYPEYHYPEQFIVDKIFKKIECYFAHIKLVNKIVNDKWHYFGFQ